MVYTSHPLNVGDSIENIRLLHLRYSNTEDELAKPIVISVHVVPLDRAPRYIALSYVWGKTESTETILIGETSVTVRPSLYTFLDRMR